MFPANENVAVPGSYISHSLITPFEFSPPAINTRPSDSLVAVWPRRSTIIVALETSGESRTGLTDELTCAGFTAGAGEATRPIIVTALPHNSSADDEVAANPVVLRAIKLIAKSERRGLFRTLIVLRTSARQNDASGGRGCNRIRDS
jgi:hypothetical protein